MTTPKYPTDKRIYSREDDGNTLVIRVTSASMNGGQAQSLGGQLLRAYRHGWRRFVLDLPGNIRLSTAEIVIGALLLMGERIELRGPGAARVQELMLEQAAG